MISFGYLSCLSNLRKPVPPVANGKVKLVLQPFSSTMANGLFGMRPALTLLLLGVLLKQDLLQLKRKQGNVGILPPLLTCRFLAVVVCTSGVFASCHQASCLVIRFQQLLTNSGIG